MKMRLSIMVLVCVAALSAKASVIYTENFETYNTGVTLNAQGSWTAAGNPKVIQGVGTNTTKVVSNGTTDNIATNAITLSWGANTKGSLSFDTYIGGTANNVGYVGIGKGTTNYLGFYMNTTSLQYRPGSGAGGMTAMVNGSGTTTALATGKWYNITANFTLADNTITDVWLTNLTDGGAAVQQYFGAGNATRVYTEAGDEAGWNTVLLRLGADTSGNTRMIDNIQVSAIPEPATIGMLGLGALITLVIRRKLMM
jgi:hypothetical protein